MRVRIDWKLTMEANPELRALTNKVRRAIRMKRGHYSVVLVEEDGTIRPPVPAFAVPEILRVCGTFDERSHDASHQGTD